MLKRKRSSFIRFLNLAQKNWHARITHLLLMRYLLFKIILPCTWLSVLYALLSNIVFMVSGEIENNDYDRF